MKEAVRHESWARRARRTAEKAFAVLVAMSFVSAPVASADRTPLKPGMNLFSPQQDIQIGRQNARQAEAKLVMLNDARVDNYLNALGERLAAHAPGERYPYQFRCVNDRAINAFALPGGFVYVNRGVIEAADDEAQLAGVMAHEISHVALRHGTNQASKAELTQGLAGLAGFAGGVTGAVAQLGADFGAQSVLLKMSRSAESQADILGTQILFDANYDPRALAQFFEKIEEESKGKQSAEFFSNHPNPDHRSERVQEEVSKLGGPRNGYVTDSEEFRDIKRHVMLLPPPPKGGSGALTQNGQPGGPGRRTGDRPDPPSDRFQSFENENLQIRFPDNWRSTSQGDMSNFVPDGGVVTGRNGQSGLVYGVIVNMADPRGKTLQEATEGFIDDLRHSNSAVQVRGRREQMRMDGLDALSTYLTNDSTAGGKETDWVVTVLRPRGLLYIVCVAPENEFDSYRHAFETMVNSVRFSK
jgi:hypothetical protein